MGKFVSFLKIQGEVFDYQKNPVRRWHNSASKHKVEDLYIRKDTFHIDELETSYYITREAQKTFEDRIDVCLKTTKELTGKTIYVAPGVDLPRTKLREYCEANNLKIVRDHSKADNVIVSKKTMNSIIKYNGRRWYTTSAKSILKALEHNKEFFPNGGYEEIQKYCEEHSNLVLESNYELHDVLIHIINNTSSNAEWNSSNYELKKVSYEPFFSAVIDGELNLVSDSSILADVNKSGSLAIDEETFESLKLMLASTDAGNHSLAMEIMANSNYEESAHYLYLLFRSYSYNIEKAHGYKHVNFTSLVNYLGTKRSLTINFDFIINKMVSKRLLTKENLKILFDNSQSDFSNSSRYFLVNTFTLTKELQDYFEGENMIFDAH